MYVYCNTYIAGKSEYYFSNRRSRKRLKTVQPVMLYTFNNNSQNTKQLSVNNVNHLIYLPFDTNCHILLLKLYNELNKVLLQEYK